MQAEGAAVREDDERQGLTCGDMILVTYFMYLIGGYLCIYMSQ